MGDLAGWPYWKVVSITGQAGAGTDYQVELEIGDSAGGDFHLEGHCTNFPQDIRITDDDGTTLLDHWVEDLTADPIVVYVEVKDDLGSNRDVRVYYGKNGESTASNISNTFIWGDDIESYNTGDLNGQGGWSGDTDFDVSTTRPKYGSKGIEVQQIIGDVTISKGSLSFGSTYALRYFINIDTTDGRIMIQEKEDATVLTYIFFRNPGKDGNSDIMFGFTDTTVNWAVDTWYEIELIKRSNGNYDVWINGVEKLTDTAPTAAGSTNTIKLDHMWEGSSTHYIDTFTVRKYNSPEPAFSSAGAEQSSTLVSVFIRHNPALTGGMV